MCGGLVRRCGGLVRRCGGLVRRCDCLVRCGGLVVSVSASRSTFLGSNLGPGGLPTEWSEGRQIVKPM